MMKRKTSN